MAKITYQYELTACETDLSLTLLDVSLKNGLPHVHVCGGRARCSTCRVLVLDGPERLLPRTAAEQALATRRGFDASVRLACQAGICGDVTVRRLVMDETDTRLAVRESGEEAAREADLAILFSDIRNFTVFAESNLPYDVVHVLNRYFKSVGDAIIGSGGYIDKYMGDGVMALFGLAGEDARAACDNAIRAALRIRSAADEVNDYIAKLTDARFRSGIGIHFGTAVVGDIGHPLKRQFTAIGDAVNVASRIESATKRFGVDILVSQSVADRAGPDFKMGRAFEAVLRGKTGVFTLHEIAGVDDPVGE